ACEAAPASVSGEARSAFRALTDALAAPAADAGLTEWAHTLAGEIAQRRGDAAAAEALPRRARARSARSVPARRVRRLPARPQPTGRSCPFAQGLHPQRQPATAAGL